MTTQIPSRAQIDRAQPLEFDRKPARQELTITVKARFNGFDTEICFSGQLEQLDAITKRLAALGGEPVTTPAAPAAAPARKPAQRVEPLYQPDGTACCPVHLRPLQPGQYGSFCPAKAKPGEDANAKGYCALRFSE